MKKLKLDQLKVKSFVTQLREKEEDTVKGGDTESIGLSECTIGQCKTNTHLLNVL